MDLIDALAGIGRPRLLVVGDLMLDRYTWCEAERISPEAPVLVMRAGEEEVRPGGAASVAALLRGLEAQVSLAGIVGNDANGRVLQRIIDEAGIDASLVFIDSARPTTAKERFLGRAGRRQPHQLLRVDRETRTTLPPNLEADLFSRIRASIDDYYAVLISDYAKGACTPSLVAAVISLCRKHNCPVLIDPARISSYEHYRGATLLKPNRTELQLASGSPIHTTDAAIAQARRLCHRLDLDAVVATLDSEGMVLVEGDDDAQVIPTRPLDVCDVTGAGDMSLAMLGLCAAADVPLTQSVQLANHAAGLESQKLGIVSITRSEINKAIRSHRPTANKRVSLDQMATLATQYRAQRKRLVFTNGCFDLLHVGHVTCLEAAALLGDVLVVALNSDASIRHLKGSSRPVIPEDDRAEMIAALACVDHVLVFDQETPHMLLELLRPDVLVKGGSTAYVVGREVVEAYGGQVLQTGFLERCSTTRIVSSVLSTNQG